MEKIESPITSTPEAPRHNFREVVDGLETLLERLLFENSQLTSKHKQLILLAKESSKAMARAVMIEKNKTKFIAAENNFYKSLQGLLSDLNLWDSLETIPETEMNRNGAKLFLSDVDSSIGPSTSVEERTSLIAGAEQCIVGTPVDEFRDKFEELTTHLGEIIFSQMEVGQTNRQN